MTTTKRKPVPLSACHLRHGVLLEIQPQPAAKQGEKPAPRTFNMVANTGKVLAHPWWGNLGIDLAGVQFKQALPALLDHDPSKRVGYTTRVAVTDAGLEASGNMLANEHAQVVLADAADGYPWQASVYLEPGVVEVLEAGATSTVNGQPIQGPGHIFRTSTLREVTFTTLGADDDTTAATLASGQVDAEFTQPEEEPMEPKIDSTALLAAVAAMSVVQLQAHNPQLAAELAKVRKEGADDERARVAAILGAADLEQADLAAQLVKDGKPAAEAVLALSADLRKRTASLRQQVAALGGRQANTPMGGGNEAGDGDAGAGAGNAEHAQLRAQFDAGPEGDKLFAAWLRNRSRTRRVANDGGAE